MLFTALHRLLGRGPCAITDELIDAAVESALAETDDLDWKSELPPLKALPQSDFPKDVAAMANRGGGTIVYGVKEADKKATGRCDVGDFDERYERALRSAAVTAITPPLFGLEVHPVGELGKRTIVVVVPAAVDGPHLIYRNEYFGAPIRNDADTVWMKERQIEAMYRARFDERRHATEALTNLYEEAASNWSNQERALLIAVAHPRMPLTGPARTTRDQARAMFSEAVELALVYAGSGGIHPLESVDRFNPRPGLRRWIAVNTATTDPRKWREAWAAVHHDGSVSLAAAIGGHRTSAVELRNNQIQSSGIECAVADFMALIRAASTQLGVGEYEARVGIERMDAKPLFIHAVDGPGFPYDGNSIPMARFAPVSATVIADAEPVDYYWQVHDLAEDCVNQGGITNLQMISPPPRN